MTTQQILEQAKAAKNRMMALSSADKQRALFAMADELEASCADILLQNRIDIDAARGHISDVMIDRLLLNEKRIVEMAQGMRQVAALPDPVGRVLKTVDRPGGLQIQKVSVPMGVVAIIYESRPNVTSDAAALCVRSGNVCVLRGGREAFHSANAIVQALRSGLRKVGLPEDIVNLLQDTSRKSAEELMRAVGYVDLLIPRGGAGLIRACVENALVPCIQTGTGICHVYVDKDADLDMALSIVENAKTSRPSVCNAQEVCLVHKDIASAFLPRLKQRIPQVELRTDGRAYALIGGTPAVQQDFDTEFLDYILAVKVVDSAQEAIAHIAAHSTAHSDAIITENEETADLFVSFVDSAAVYVNCSTRFTDGGEFGLGCEMGISTQKLHARGPMGLEELTSYKYVIRGQGQIR